MEGRIKPGRRWSTGGPNRFAAEYERWGLSQGYTVAEWEAILGYPPYTIYPFAKDAQTMADRGYYMYKNATEEEKAVMEQTRTKRSRNKILKKAMERKRIHERDRDE